MGPQPQPRTVTVAGSRIVGWVDRFVTRHGGTVAATQSDGYLLTGSDGETALLRPIIPLELVPDHEVSIDVLAQKLLEHSALDRRLGVVLVRRGGYAVGVAEATAVVASKSGTRYVQSRTAAGGWSQQRFARRRTNQADELVEAVAAHAEGIFSQQPRLDYLVTGGDKNLVREVLSEPIMRSFVEIPVAFHANTGDPKTATLGEVVVESRSIRITLS